MYEADVCNNELHRKGIFHEAESSKHLTICPRHRDAYGLRWRCNKRICAVPTEMAAHKLNTAKGDRGVDFAQSAMIFQHSHTLVPIGSHKKLHLPLLQSARTRSSSHAREGEKYFTRFSFLPPLTGLVHRARAPLTHYYKSLKKGRVHT